MKTAIVYDRVNKWGGAERVLLALHAIFPDAPLYTSVYNRETALWAQDFDIKTSFLQKLPKAKTSHEVYFPLMPIAFEQFNFDDYDLVISVTSEASKGIITKPSTFHVCYCLTPTRYLWSGYLDYFDEQVTRNLSRPALNYAKKWDLVASQRPDAYIAISNEVKNRIRKYYERDSSVIYPPVMLEKNSKDVKAGDYYLTVSRLSSFTPYKNMKILIEAFNKTGMPLVVVGKGNLENGLKKIAKSNIRFKKDLSDLQLSELYLGSNALVFPALEDFGLAMAEAQHFGKPILAFRGGGALEIIKEGKTGDFFDKQDVNSIVDSLEKFKHKRYNTSDILENSDRFSFDSFRKNFVKYISDTLN